MRHRSYRIKLVVPGIEAHYWHSDTLEDAERIVAELAVDMAGVDGARIWLYIDTRHGHARVPFDAPGEE